MALGNTTAAAVSPATMSKRSPPAPGGEAGAAAWGEFMRRLSFSVQAGLAARARPCRPAPRSEPFLDIPERIVGGLVAADLALGQHHLLDLDRLVRHVLEDVADDVQAHALLVFGAGHEPGRPGGVGGGEHLVARLGVVVPAVVGLQVHGGELPGLAAVADARLQPSRLFLGADFQPVFEQDDAGVDHQPFEQRHRLQEGARRVLRAEAHHALDAGAVVPAAVEDDDFARRRQVRDVALAVHLGLLALGRRRQRDDAEDARAHALGDGLDGAALAGAVAALEDDADLEPLVHDPLLQRHQFGVQLLQFALVGLARELAASGRGVFEIFPGDGLIKGGFEVAQVDVGGRFGDSQRRQEAVNIFAADFGQGRRRAEVVDVRKEISGGRSRPGRGQPPPCISTKRSWLS